MAKKLKKFEYSQYSRRAGYAWATWLDGNAWRLTRGEDFQVAIGTLRTQAFLAAKRRGGKVRTSIVDPNTIDIQFVKNEA